MTTATTDPQAIALAAKLISREVRRAGLLHSIRGDEPLLVPPRQRPSGQHQRRANGDRAASAVPSL